MSEFGGHLINLYLVDAITGYFIDDLIHLNQQLSSNTELLNDLLLHSHIMTLMGTEEGACGADALAVLDADDL